MAQTDASKNPYSYLERLSTSTLEEMISSDFSESGHHNDELVFAVLEELKKRNAAQGQLLDINDAWSKFREHYDTPDMTGISLYGDSVISEPLDQPPVSESPKTRRNKLFRRIVTIAATLAILLCGVIAVQAAGIDIFGSLATWTEETFHFVSGSSQENNTKNALASALVEADMPSALAPTWFPEGFVPEDIQTLIDTDCSVVSLTLINGEQSITYYTEWYADESLIDTLIFEKDDSPIEIKEINGVQYYIMSNNDAWITAWQEGNYVGFIGGAISYDDLIKIIESIGEGEH